MKYIEQQRAKVIELRDRLFNDPGYGVFMGKKREFVLSNPSKNLWPDIRQEAIDYFHRNNIGWWKSKDKPSGHLLSSQVACVNHLFPIRQRQDLADAMLKQVDTSIKRALLLDDGFVEFEKTGEEALGNEKSLTRGANSTSIDALMLGEKHDGSKVLILIEWKYTEHYTNNSLLYSGSGTSRLDNYKELLESPDSPIQCEKLEALFHEPFYQLMRQTLLGWTMTQRKEYGAADWLHLHIVPQENKDLKEKVTSPGLKGRSMEDAWKGVLLKPERYIVMAPNDFLAPLTSHKDTKNLSDYLNERYWKS